MALLQARWGWGGGKERVCILKSHLSLSFGHKLARVWARRAWRAGGAGEWKAHLVCEQAPRLWGWLGHQLAVESGADSCPLWAWVFPSRMTREEQVSSGGSIYLLAKLASWHHILGKHMVHKGWKERALRKQTHEIQSRQVP